MEYFLRDAYEYYGYGFNYYDGGPVDEERVKELIQGFTAINSHIREVYRQNILGDVGIKVEDGELTEELQKAAYDTFLDSIIAQKDATRMLIAKTLLRGLRLKGQPLRMMPRLELDPALLEQPLYH